MLPVTGSARDRLLPRSACPCFPSLPAGARAGRWRQTQPLSPAGRCPLGEQGLSHLGTRRRCGTALPRASRGDTRLGRDPAGAAMGPGPISSPWPYGVLIRGHGDGAAWLGGSQQGGGLGLCPDGEKVTKAVGKAGRCRQPAGAGRTRGASEEPCSCGEAGRCVARPAQPPLPGLLQDLSAPGGSHRWISSNQGPPKAAGFLPAGQWLSPTGGSATASTG